MHGRTRSQIETVAMCMKKDKNKEAGEIAPRFLMARREMVGTRDFVQRYENRALRKIAIKMNKEIWTFVGLYTVKRLVFLEFSY